MLVQNHNHALKPIYLYVKRHTTQDESHTHYKFQQKNYATSEPRTNESQKVPAKGEKFYF